MRKPPARDSKQIRAESTSTSQMFKRLVLYGRYKQVTTRMMDNKTVEAKSWANGLLANTIGTKARKKERAMRTRPQ